ncbi:hypothetical protein I316_04917 [Kwoniella heveanensis BCC8398]|uniref:DUF3835 domain-containing protein n=1 Tax=Kwoniella heveanensis BCC8398 TaxID=1296120 RepID=A0A1B9GR47_9TREE|nr:hypothetical protein I316_04917 [Kwoniella heveanensis BCC8398]
MPADHDEPLSLPIEPSSPSLHSHLAALDILSLRLSSLTSSTSHSVRIPLTSKASIRGTVIHTNDIKVNLGGASLPERAETPVPISDSSTGTEREAEVNVGQSQSQQHGGWWVDMTATEASQYVRRRKRNLLEHHARLSEGTAIAAGSSRHFASTDMQYTDGAGEAVRSSQHATSLTSLFPSIGLHPLFYSISSTPPSPPRTTSDIGKNEYPNPTSQALSSSRKVEAELETSTQASSAKSSDKEKGQAQSPKSTEISSPFGRTPASITASSDNSSAGSRKPDTTGTGTSVVSGQINTPAKSVQPPTAQGASLVEILDDEGEESSQQVGLGDDTTLNEEGLPFHEIRETLDGETIGPAPPASASADEASSLTAEDNDDYDTPEAIARRAALRRKLFGEGSDSAGEGEVGEIVSSVPARASGDVHIPIQAKGGIIRVSSAVAQKPPSSSAATTPATTSSPPVPESLSPPSSALAERRASSSMPAPSKSILKPPTRKKSVSFDPSIPPPPESPDKGSTGAGKIGFDLPWANVGNVQRQEEYGLPKPVPVISTPHPTKKHVEEKGFAGFKKGFLAGPPKVKTNQDDQRSTSTSAPSMTAPPKSGSPAPDAVKSIVKESAPTPSSSLAKAADPTPQPPPLAPRKPSLFAQRLSQPEIDASAPNINTTTSIRTPSLPKASETKSTNTVKPSVVEKPPIPATARVEVKPIVERPPAVRQVPTNAGKPVGSSSGTTANSGSRSRAGQAESEATFADDGAEEVDDDDEGDDDGLEDFSSAEEDEYDLDDALLAREVALEYHRRQAYQPLNRDPDDFPNEEELGEAGDGGGGVMLGLPRISDVDPHGQGPLIINPTPDDLRRFVRVGRLENGNLILAPGEAGFPLDSDEEEEEDVQSQTPASGRDQVRNQDLSPEEQERLQRKQNREAIKRKLMGLDGPDDLSSSTGRAGKAADRAEHEWKSSLPPSLASAQQNQEQIEGKDTTDLMPPAGGAGGIIVASAVKETKPNPVIPSSVAFPSKIQRGSSPGPAPAPATSTELPPAFGDTNHTREEAPASPKPKKVSRFKAARMAGN